MQKKRIICTVTNDLNNDQRMRRICNTLTESNFDVILIGRKNKNSIALQSTSYKQVRLSLLFYKGKLFYIEYQIRLFFYLLFCKFDIVNAVDLDTILPCLFISKIKGKKVTYDAHEYFSELPEVVDRIYTKKLWELVAKYSIPKMDACYTVGNSLAKLLSERYNISFETIRNVPYQTNIKKVGYSGSKIIIYQGALNDGRGLEAIIHTMTKLPKEYIFWIVGSGYLAGDLKLLVDQYGISDQVKFWGIIPIDKLASITIKADVGINLLENKGLNYYYSLSNKTFDYIQANLPAINIAFPEYIALNQQYETSVLCKDLSESSILESIHKIFDQSVYNRLQNNCKIAAQNLIWEKEKLKLVEIYKNNSH